MSKYFKQLVINTDSVKGNEEQEMVFGDTDDGFKMNCYHDYGIPIGPPYPYNNKKQLPLLYT